MNLTTNNIIKINNFLFNLLQECNKNNAEVELETSLTNALTEMKNEDETYTEIKKYQYISEIEMYPQIQYINANTAEEAIELIKQKINVEFINELVPSDFGCVTAEIVKPTPEYKAYCEIHEIKLEK
jgi:hypothetical protein